MIKGLVRKFWAQTEWPGRDFFQQTDKEVARIFFIVRAFYCSLLFFACYGFVDALREYGSLSVDPLWPLIWMKWSGQGIGIPLVLLLSLFGSLAGAWKPDWRGSRILAFLGCLEGMALDNSFGKINNHLHLWTVVAFMLIFLPREKDALREPEVREGTLRLFWGAQAFILLTYSMSGIAKLLGAVLQIARGDTHTLFQSDALARHVAERLMETSETSLLGPWIISHPTWGWLPFLGAVYLEVFALTAAFRPSLQRPWALGLVLMHIGIFLSMDVTFSNSILLLSLFFFASPFSARVFSIKQRIRDIPLFGPFLIGGWDAFFRSSKKQDVSRSDAGQTLVFYDGACGICNRWIAFLLSRKLPPDLRFATLQGELYRTLKNRYPVLESADTLVIYRLESETESIRIRSEGVFWLLPQLPGWTRWTLVVNLIPMFVLNIGYRCVARLRHRLGKNVECPVIPETYRGYFLEEPSLISPSLSGRP
jgi:predicted DCC family thiol-disulfide oxidoreductase YuxK